MTAPLFLADTMVQHLMVLHDEYPQSCEFEYITKSAITACDSLDGITDGLLSHPEQCTFDANTLRGSIIPCPASPGNTTTLSDFAIYLVQQFWKGPHSLSNHPLHPGFAQEASLIPLALTTCNHTTTTSPSPTCQPTPWNLVTHYFYNFVLRQKPPSIPARLPKLSTPEFLSLYARARVHLHSAISAWQPDLSLFSQAAHRPKMITWHGLADNLIAANHSLEYYKAVRRHFGENRADYAGDVNGVEDFYRYFEVPGVKHCGFGAGPVPGTCFDGKKREGVDDRGSALEALERWVEEGTAPERMRAVSEVRADLLEGEGKEGWDGRLRRPLCAWPKRAEWRGGKKGKWWDEEGWECVERAVDV